MAWPLVSMVIMMEADIVAVRQRARHLAELLNFERQDQTRIATAVSEIARNAYSYANGGRVEFILLETTSPQMLLIRISDRGPGIADLDRVLEGRFQSTVGMGLGITGARRLLDHFKIESSTAGTVVELGHRLPPRVPVVTREMLPPIVAALKSDKVDDPLAALRDQNRELMQSMEEIRRRQEEAAELNSELGDTNRGVVALYAELDERAEQLRRASESKSRFLSNMSHEFRTPLTSIMALSRLLLDGVDGELNTEQLKQIGYIRKSAEDLLELVNDLLDLAKVEAGRIELRLAEFNVADLFGGLRGSLKPLRDKEVALIFDPATDLPALYSDEGKVTQVLRNFISNALKFTQSGEVHVSAHYDSREARITFAVADTGIGIAPEDQERIFEEFTQIDGELQKAAKGTGLGLPLTRKLAELMKGEVWVESEVGRGSTFYLTIPVELPGRPVAGAVAAADPTRKKVLLIDDDETFRYVLRQIVHHDGRYDIIEAVDGEQGLRSIEDQSPDVVVLDLQMPRLDGFAVLEKIRSNAATRALPVIISTSLQLDDETMMRLPAHTPILSKQMLSREQVLSMLLAATGD
jgi:signal transduction histidine kinase